MVLVLVHYILWQLLDHVQDVEVWGIKLIVFSVEADLGSEGFGDLLGSIRAKNISLENIHFVVWSACVYKSI